MKNYLSSEYSDLVIVPILRICPKSVPVVCVDWIYLNICCQVCELKIQNREIDPRSTKSQKAEEKYYIVFRYL